jgi:hypothetical protein
MRQIFVNVLFWYVLLREGSASSIIWRCCTFQPPRGTWFALGTLRSNARSPKMPQDDHMKEVRRWQAR